MATRTIQVTIAANLSWQASGVFCNPNDSIDVSYIGGNWTQNPVTGLHDWRGDGGHQEAGGEYALPGAPEGCLLFRVGGGATTRFATSTVHLPNNSNGEVAFVINDDLRHVSGHGLGDNSGSLSLAFTISSR